MCGSIPPALYALCLEQLKSWQTCCNAAELCTLEDQYIGPQGVGLYSLEYYKQENYKVVDHREFYDPKLHFGLDQEKEFEYWHNPDQTLRIHYSTELISKLRKMIVQDRVEFVWLTMWNEQAPKLLNKLFGFPKDVINWQVWPRRDDYYQVSKPMAIKDFYSKVPRSERRPFIWVDDVATYSSVTWPMFAEGEYKYGPNPFKKQFGVDALILQTNPHYGIQRAEWQAIEYYVETGKVPRRHRRIKKSVPDVITSVDLEF